MSSNRRQKIEAMKKRGQTAFDKRKARKTHKPKCNKCGTECRPTKLQAGLCPLCFEGKR
jgi:predicted Zn-ribbon and HTH transcriptional regulator